MRECLTAAGRVQHRGEPEGQGTINGARSEEPPAGRDGEGDSEDSEGCYDWEDFGGRKGELREEVGENDGPRGTSRGRAP